MTKPAYSGFFFGVNMRHFGWKLNQNSNETTTASTQFVRFGDGYEQAASFGINNISKAWQASITDKKPIIDEIYRFLISTKNVEVFTIAPVEGEPTIKVRCVEDITRNHVGASVWTIQFKLKQAF